MTLRAIKFAVLLAIAANLLPGQPFTISTFAGGAPPVTPAPALQTSIGFPQALAADAHGNIYFTGLNCVFKLDSAGTLTVVAGNGRQGFSGDGGPATEAQISLPWWPYANPGVQYSFAAGLAVTPSGDILIADIGNNRIRKVSRGIITTVAGGGDCSDSCDGQPATQLLVAGSRLAVDSSGDLYFVGGYRTYLYKVTPDGMATLPYGPKSFGGASAIALDPSGGIYFAQAWLPKVYKLTPDGTVTPVAGNGAFGYSGDGGPATSAQLMCPVSLIVDHDGSLIIGDAGNGGAGGYGTIRRVTGDGKISTIAGRPWYFGDPTSNSGGFTPWGLVLDAAGDLLIADTYNSRIRKLSNSLITNVAGSNVVSFIGDGGPASQAIFSHPMGLAHDRHGDLFVADIGRVRRISRDGIVSTVAGNGSYGYSGDGGQAISAQISAYNLAVDLAGNLYIAGEGVIRKVTRGGIISTFAGTGVFGYSGDGGPANAAQLGRFLGLAVDHSGNIYIADASEARLRKVSVDGIVTTIAGNGTHAPIVDGSLAINSSFAPQALVIDNAGNIYAGVGQHVYKISADGIISPVVGAPGGSPPTGSTNGTVSALALDAAGNIYLSDSENGMVFRISTDGIFEPVAGSGYVTNSQGDITFNYSCDGGPALDAQFAASGLAIDRDGNIYVSDPQNNAIRMLTTSATHRRPH